MRSLLVMAFIIGQCVQITSGILKNGIFKISEVNQDGTYTLYDGEWTVTEVPEKLLRPVDSKYCEEKK